MSPTNGVPSRVSQVQQALDGIPHDEKCGAHFCDGCANRRGSCPDFIAGPCTCSRPQRITERVAAAIQKAHARSADVICRPTCGCLDAALAELSRVSPVGR